MSTNTSNTLSALLERENGALTDAYDGTQFSTSLTQVSDKDIEETTANNSTPFFQQEEPVTLTWNDLEVAAGSRQLLKNINGLALPGETIALMGASGAGKTTLLNTLLGRNLKGLSIKGEILVNGNEIGRGITNISSYVQQEDLFMGRLTVYEHLLIQAYIRLPSRMSHKDRKECVEHVIKELDLEACRNSKIGFSGVKKGISGGQAKRLAFATEILTNPSILFCDEPTTGLDSHMASQVVKTLNKLSKTTKKTIICTIHQPSSEVFESFDRVIFLALGEVAFQGPPSCAIGFFSYIGFSFPSHCNPADLFIMYLALEPGNEDESMMRVKSICKKYQGSQHYRIVKERIEYHKQYPHSTVDMPRPPGLFIIIVTMVLRLFLDHLRNPSFIKVKTLQKTCIGVFLAFLYFRTPMNQDGIANFKGLFYFMISETTYSTALTVQTIIPKDFHLVVREHHDGIYPVSAYYIARILAFLPFASFDSIVMCILAYFIAGLTPTVSSFLMCLFVIGLTSWCTFAYAIMISSLLINYPLIVSTSAPILAALAISGGLFMNISTFPSTLNWLHYFSWFKYSFELLLINEFGGRENIECIMKSNGSYIKVDGSCLRTGEDVLKSLSFSSNNHSFNIYVLIIYTLTTLIVGYLFLVYRVLKAR
uniref:ATP-binding cassette sub-family G member 2 (inferred by orthology to a human protein) n=1 Tax=Strongyloides venezuelensis TaxID=75913 RepID=A0A0K0EWC0_STRVS